MPLVGQVTPQVPFSSQQEGGVTTEIESDFGGISRLTTSGHPNLPAPPHPDGYCELETGLDGARLGEVNLIVKQTRSSFIVDVFVSTPHVVGEVRDGTNPVQTVQPVVTPEIEGHKAQFVLPRAETGKGPELRVYYRQTWSQQEPAPDTSWIFYKAAVYRYDP